LPALFGPRDPKALPGNQQLDVADGHVQSEPLVNLWVSTAQVTRRPVPDVGWPVLDFLGR
jgi:hypothetical protein